MYSLINYIFSKKEKTVNKFYELKQIIIQKWNSLNEYENTVIDLV